MDKIQKFLVTAGRKDLAQEYYEKVAKIDFRHYDVSVGKDQGIEMGSNDLIRACGIDGLRDYLSTNIVKGTRNMGGFAYFSQGKPGVKYMNRAGRGVLVIKNSDIKWEEFDSTRKDVPPPKTEIIAKESTSEGAIGGSSGTKIIIVYPFRDIGHRVKAYMLKDKKYVLVEKIDDLKDYDQDTIKFEESK